METITSGLMSPKSSTGDNDFVTDSEPEVRKRQIPQRHESLKPNKRKNFQPRCSSLSLIYNNNNNNEPGMGTDDDVDEEDDEEGPQKKVKPIDLSAKSRETKSGDRDMQEFAAKTMRELFHVYGLPSDGSAAIGSQLPRRHVGESEEPPTPPKTPVVVEQQLDNDGDDEREDSDTLGCRDDDDDDYDEEEEEDYEICDENGKLKQPLDLPTNLNDESLEAIRTRISDLTRLAALHNPAILLQSGLSIPSLMSFNTGFDVKSRNENLVTKSNSKPSVSQRTHQLGQLATQSQPFNLDYSKYVRKFDSFHECNSRYCKELNYREHFHCLDCNLRVFIKKEEMIRHFKWHKKREESLQHGFMRYSPTDDCSDKYRDCSHNHKQTHYHCIYSSCDKVYISTSDVQMHANFHRKDSAIIQEGFQRLRATEECKTEYCLFYGQKTTHFHCRRSNCTFTFKNKADMEKHKTFHIKDEQLLKDGFKKFMKNDPCPYPNCRFSKICNHIHCIRPRCTYVLHSSGQLFSHKRKHERKSSELSYRKFKMAQVIIKSLKQQDPSSLTPALKSLISTVNMDSLETYLSNWNGVPSAAESSGDEQNSSTSSFHDDFDPNELNFDDPGVAIDYLQSVLSGVNAGFENGGNDNAELWRKYCQFYAAGVSCVSQECPLFYMDVDHYHCMLNNCQMSFKLKEQVDDHCRSHDRQNQITDEYYSSDALCNETCQLHNNQQKHYHCRWENCNETVLDTKDKPFRRLEHYKIHERSKRLNCNQDSLTMSHLATSIDSIFNRKRGRPPKNRVIEVWNGYNSKSSSPLTESPQAIFTSFKLPKPTALNLTNNNFRDEYNLNFQDHCVEPPISNLEHNLNMSDAKTGLTCTISDCTISTPNHYHCSVRQCKFGTKSKDELADHENDFHKNFQYFDIDTDCTYPSCLENKINSHYHCLRPHCNMIFTNFDVLENHKRLHDSPQPMNLTCQTDNDVKSSKADSNVFENSNSQVLYGPEFSCSRPFCKLKRKFHYHCTCCNQAFSEIDRLSFHMQKHNGSLPISPVPSSKDMHTNTIFNFLSPNPLLYLTPKRVLQETSTSLDKKMRVTPSTNSLGTSTRALKDEPVPEGYSRFRFNEDCKFVNCGYREHQTHFHCQREACGYSFCDKTRFVQHTARHERLDTLMGGDFRQYRANVPCNYIDCVYSTTTLGPTGQNKASHFHCLKCDYVCSDTNKVVAHRRFHQKMDSIQAAGFEKFTPSQQCRGGITCPHANKQTHYHCLSCQYTVLGLAQMTAHKYRHLDAAATANFIVPHVS